MRERSPAARGKAIITALAATAGAGTYVAITGDGRSAEPIPELAPVSPLDAPAPSAAFPTTSVAVAPSTFAPSTASGVAVPVADAPETTRPRLRTRAS